MIAEKLQGKRVLVTAGAQGIGEAISRRFIEMGARVAIHYFSSDKTAQKLLGEAEARGAKALAYQADLGKREQVEKMLQKIETDFGGLDILINNAGSLIGRRDLESVEDEFWDQVWDVNMRSMFLVSQASVPLLTRNEASSMVNIASLAGRKGGHAGSLVYSTTKGAVLTWTRSLASELGPRGVRVNAVAPGLILGTSFHNTHTTAESAAETVKGIPLNRAGNADDVARAVVYMASEYNGFITGSTLDLNGGVYAC